MHHRLSWKKMNSVNSWGLFWEVIPVHFGMSWGIHLPFYKFLLFQLCAQYDISKCISFQNQFFMEFVRTFIDIKCWYQVFWRKLIDLGGVRLCGWIQTFCGCLTWKRRHLHKIVSSLVWPYRSSYIKLLDAIGLLVDGQDSDVGRIYLKVTGKKIKLAWGNGWLQAHMMRFFDLLSIW